MLAPGMVIQQILIESIGQRLDAAGIRAINVQFIAYACQHFRGGLPWIDDVCHVRIFRHFCQHMPAKRSLACAHFAREHHNPAFALHGIKHMRQSFLMPWAHKQVLRIRRNGEWLSLKIEIRLIHG